MIDDDALRHAYATVGKPADRLPFSPDFDRLLALYRERAGHDADRRELWNRLIDLRKRGSAPRLGRRSA